MEIPKEVNDAINSHITNEMLKEIETMTEQERLEWNCKRMNKKLEPAFQRDFVCEKCHNAGIYYIVMNNDIVGVICECYKKEK